MHFFWVIWIRISDLRTSKEPMNLWPWCTMIRVILHHFSTSPQRNAPLITKGWRIKHTKPHLLPLCESRCIHRRSKQELLSIPVCPLRTWQYCLLSTLAQARINKNGSYFCPMHIERCTVNKCNSGLSWNFLGGRLQHRCTLFMDRAPWKWPILSSCLV